MEGDCYVPRTAFLTPGGGFLAVGECKEGSKVLASDGSVITTIYSELLEPKKYDLTENYYEKGMPPLSLHAIAVGSHEL